MLPTVLLLSFSFWPFSPSVPPCGVKSECVTIVQPTPKIYIGAAKPVKAVYRNGKKVPPAAVKPVPDSGGKTVEVILNKTALEPEVIQIVHRGD